MTIIDDVLYFSNTPARAFQRRTPKEFWDSIANHCDRCAPKKLDRKTDNAPVAVHDETECMINYWGA
jgi:hypothetical protein